MQHISDDEIIDRLLEGFAAGNPQMSADALLEIRRRLARNRICSCDTDDECAAIPLCECCQHKATLHVVDGEERRECMEWQCSCEQYEHPIHEVPR